MSTNSIVSVTTENAMKETLFCIKDKKSPGFKDKLAWLEKRYEEGLRIKILKDEKKKMIGFIEYVPAEFAWRPMEADGFMFIHCLYVGRKKDRNQGNGALLINEAISDAKKLGMHGVCVMTSAGGWMTQKTIFENNGFEQVDARGRFELMSLKWNDDAADPKLIDWTLQQEQYEGWHLLYADQCPWHDKCVSVLKRTASDYGIPLMVHKITSPEEARMSPSGFGVFSLLRDGKLLEDHYISNTRFVNILKKELGDALLEIA